MRVLHLPACLPARQLLGGIKIKLNIKIKIFSLMLKDKSITKRKRIEL